jgi:hypothetical protein
MVGASVRPMTTGTALSGFDAAVVLPAESPSRSTARAGALGAGQLTVPPTGLRAHCRGRTSGAVRPSLPRPIPLPDPSTLRRWVRRRLLSLACWLKAGIIGEWFFRSPTILGWDLAALCRILPIEARSP